MPVTTRGWQAGGIFEVSAGPAAAAAAAQALVALCAELGVWARGGEPPVSGAELRPRAWTLPADCLCFYVRKFTSVCSEML